VLDSTSFATIIPILSAEMATITRTKIKQNIKDDLIAGLTVAILVIPQAMGYALIAGVPPIYGLYTAFIPLMIYPLFGSSPHIIVGCAAIPSMMVFSSLSSMADPFTEEYIQLTAMLTFLIGACLIFFRLIKFGKLSRLISRSVIYGYTAGAAILILVSQLKYMLKANVDDASNNLSYFKNIFSDFSSVHLLSLGMGLVSLLFLLIMRKINKKIPSAIFVLVIGIVAANFLNLGDKGVELVKEIPAGLPSIGNPLLDWQTTLSLFPFAIIIALVAYVQSYAIAKTFAMQGKDEGLDPNKELFGLGASNLISAFFFCFPSTGSLTKSAVNYDAGSKTGFSSLFAGSIIGLVLLFFTSYFFYLPKTILASIIIIAVLKFINIKGILGVLKNSKYDFLMLVITFLVTLFVNIQLGVFLGVFISVLLSIYRVGSFSKFFDLFKQTGQVANVENDEIKIFTPILYTNANNAYLKLKQQIKSTGYKRLNASKLRMDSDGIDVIDKLTDEFGLTVINKGYPH